MFRFIYLVWYSSSSIWQVEGSTGRWKTLNFVLSTWLEDAWRNDADGRTISLDDREVQYSLNVQLLLIDRSVLHSISCAGQSASKLANQPTSKPDSSISQSVNWSVSLSVSQLAR